MCLDEDDALDVQPFLDAIYCNESSQAVRYALRGRNVVMSMQDTSEGVTIPANILLTTSWSLFLHTAGLNGSEPEYLH